MPRRALLLLATLALGLAVPAASAPTLAFTVVARGDPDAGSALAELRGAAFAFVDANGNTALDRADPDEPVYLDADGGRVVSYGDVRLTAFGRYPAGTAVDVANRDVGRTLTVVPGWFAHDGETWYIDADSGNRVSAGDLRFGASGLEKVGAGDASLNRALETSQGQKGMLHFLDGDRDGGRDAMEPLLVDQDAAGAGYRVVSAGDLRLSPSGFGADDEATQADIEAALASRTAAPVPGSTTTVIQQGPDGSDGNAPATPPAAWRVLDWILVVVGVANLAGLVVVGRMATGRKPKAPSP